MTLKAVILDVYNTLFRNDTSCWVDTFRGICSSQGLPIAPEDLYSQWKVIEVRFRQTRTNMENPELSPPFSTYQSAWRQAFVDTFAMLDMRGNADEAAQMSVDGLAAREPFEDTFPFLEYVRANWKVGVLTNADNGSVIPLLQRYNLSFDALMTSEMVGAYKPDPRIFLRVLEETGVSPQETLYVGDTLLDDIHGANLVGMQTAWINHSGAERDPQLLPPDYEVTGLDELADKLRSWREVDTQ